MNRIRDAAVRSKCTRAAMLLAAGMVATGCGDADIAPGAPQSTSAMRSVSVAEPPHGESASGTLDGTEFTATRISQCQATPGYGLGIRAATENFTGQDDSGVQLFGGFEKQAGKITVDFRGHRWTAGEGTAGGRLEFDMTDARDPARQFVTVRAQGSMVGDQGGSMPFDLTLVCEPGGT